RRKRIHNAVRASRPVQPEIDVVLRAPPASSAASVPGNEERSAAWSAGSVEIMNQTEHHHIRAAACRSHVMKILAERIGRHVRQGNVIQQSLRRGGDQYRVQNIWARLRA